MLRLMAFFLFADVNQPRTPASDAGTCSNPCPLSGFLGPSCQAISSLCLNVFSFFESLNATGAVPRIQFAPPAARLSLGAPHYKSPRTAPSLFPRLPTCLQYSCQPLSSSCALVFAPIVVQFEVFVLVPHHQVSSLLALPLLLPRASKPKSQQMVLLHHIFPRKRHLSSAYVVRGPSLAEARLG